MRTPHLDRLARRGALCVQAIVDVPVTLPSHATLMTGIPALAHGVRYNADFAVGPSARTLAERFSERGHATAAVVSSLVLDARFGLDQGFDTYDDDLSEGYVRHDPSLPENAAWLPRGDRRADEVTDRALAWLAEAPLPFFLWAHFYDPHFPYDPPPSWRATHAHPYAAEIQFTDRQLGRLLRGPSDTGLPEHTVVLVTADHGEGLGQHREDGHGIFLYDETVRVPLITCAETLGAGVLVPEQVRSIDVAPTLLELSGLSGKLGRGASFAAALAGRGPVGKRPAYLESIKTRRFYGGSGLKALRTGEQKLVWAPRAEAYDLRADPGETTNLIEARPDLADAVREELDAEVRELLGADAVFAVAADLDGETRERLASLGYVTGGGASAPGHAVEEMALAGHDPKDLVDVTLSAREIQNGFPERAEEKLERFFRTARRPADHPEMARLWAAAHLNAAKIRFDRGDFAGAADHYGRAIRVDPGYARARWRRIHALNLSGRPVESAAEAAELLERFPDAVKVRLHGGIALLLGGRREDARRELERCFGQATLEDVRRSARFWLDRIGTDEESEALAVYRGEG